MNTLIGFLTVFAAFAGAHYLATAVLNYAAAKQDYSKRCAQWRAEMFAKIDDPEHSKKGVKLLKEFDSRRKTR